MDILVGTSGYSYKEWKGSFYPEDLPANQMLRFYSDQFRTVEINNTFYRMPDRKMLEGWARQVPAGFRFILKAPQRITHKKRLADAEEDVGYLFATATSLGEALGPVLFQLPPYFRKDFPRLKGFLQSIPDRQKAAFEFRHASWFTDEVFDELKSHHAALCIAETDETEQLQLVPTAEWGYLRLRRTEYGDKELREWSERLKAQPWGTAYVFFKHEDEAKGPRFAARFASVVGTARA